MVFNKSTAVDESLDTDNLETRLNDGDQQSFAADSLAMGVVVMLAMTIIQRFVGFFRSIWICRILDDNEVGQWAMAITGFEMFIKSFPRSEQADQAQYYIAESYLIDGKFDQAIAASLADLSTLDWISLFYAIALVATIWVVSRRGLLAEDA